MQLHVLIACEESQAECTAFRELGHIAYSCDIQPCRKGGHPEWHIHGDCLPYLHGRTDFTTQDGVKRSVPGWDLIIAHPPCTYLTKVGAVHLRKDPDGRVYYQGRWHDVNLARWSMLVEARKFFLECLKAKADYLAVENPIPMRIAELPRPTCYADPSWFGVKYTKKTIYWLRNLPPVIAEIDYPSPKCFHVRSHGKYRSRTFPQLAMAIAKQWSAAIIADKSRQH